MLTYDEIHEGATITAFTTRKGAKRGTAFGVSYYIKKSNTKSGFALKETLSGVWVPPNKDQAKRLLEYVQAGDVFCSYRPNRATDFHRKP
jgi:hypothetical protein